MAKVFNVTGSCDSELHYMVDITERLVEINMITHQVIHSWYPEYAKYRMKKLMFPMHGRKKVFLRL